MCSGLCFLPKWLGLQLLGLYRVMNAFRSAVTPDSGVLWLAPLGPPGPGSEVTYIQHTGGGWGSFSEQLEGIARRNPPSPSAAVQVVTHCELSILQVTADAVKFTDAVERGGPSSVDSPFASSIGAKLRKDGSWMDTLGDMGERGIVDVNVFRADPTEYGVVAFTGVAGVASAPSVQGMRTDDRSAVCAASPILLFGRGCILRYPKAAIGRLHW